MDSRISKIERLIRDVPDFPEPGIVFKDITPLLADAKGCGDAFDLLAEPFLKSGVTSVLGMESRGFIFGVPVAERLGCGFVPVRKPGKLPKESLSEQFELEYGRDSLEIHQDSLSEGDSVLIVDDLLATGGTAAATVRLAKRLGAGVAGVAFVIELDFLEGRKKLEGTDIHTLVHF